HEAVVELAAEQISFDCPGRELPVGWFLASVSLDQFGQFFGIELLGVRPEQRFGHAIAGCLLWYDLGHDRLLFMTVTRSSLRAPLGLLVAECFSEQPQTAQDA